MNHSEMTQDGTTCLLSGMLSGSDSCSKRPASVSDGLHPSASLASSGCLSVSVPARPQSWEEGVSDSLPLGKNDVTTPPPMQHVREEAVTTGRHVYVSPRAKPDASLAPKKKKVDSISKIPTPNFRALGPPPLVPDERLHSSNTIQDDLRNAHLQPVAMTCSAAHTCTTKGTDASEQFACGPISSSMCDMNLSVVPHPECSISASVVESFQSLTDGKVCTLRTREQLETDSAGDHKTS